MSRGHPARRLPSAALLLALFFLAGAIGFASRAAAREAANLEDPPWDPLRQGDRPDTNDIQHAIGDTTLTFNLAGHELVIPCFANLLPEAPHPEITRAIVVIHGTLRNAGDYYHDVMHAGELAGGADSTTALIVAPQFLTETDVNADSLDGSYLYWAYMGWRQGDRSLNTVQHPRPAAMSSFAAVDSILLRLASSQPALQTIVVAGHSAGGQFVNRYAAGNQADGVLQSRYGIDVQYLVSNPSSYLYFDDTRWVPGTTDDFAVPPPDQVALCPGYNLYKYGLDSPNDYMGIGSALLRQQYSSRRVFYLLGGDDMDPNSAYLERNCEAMLEGEYRLQRGYLYRRHLVHTFGWDVLNLHYFAVVPGVAHNDAGIFCSSCGLYVLYGYGGCTPNLGNSHWEDKTSFVLRSTNSRAVSWGDCNRDGRPDMYLSSWDVTDQLLRNDPGGVFVDATPPPLADPRAGISSAWGDYDNDGFPDLYTVNSRSSCRLFHNNGGTSFTDVTAGSLAVGGDAQEASWSDFDRDGDLDLYVTRATKQLDYLFRNDGGGVFTDVSAIVPMDTLETRDAAWGDFDGDGDQDLYIVNAGGPNKLLRNDGIGFVDVTTPPLDDPGSGASACWGDYDNDGDLDLFLVNRGAGCRLFRNDGGGAFTDVAAGSMTDFTTGMSASWGDFDNDGDLDLYVVYYGGIKNRLYRNDGNDTFTNVADYPICDMGMGWSAGWADYDGDGWLDLYLADQGNWNKLFRNKGGYGNHWLEVDLRGVQSNSAGVGARLVAQAGGRTFLREVGSESGFLSQNAATVHFGLGSAAIVDTLRIRWPSGIVQTEFGFPADRRITITESELPATVPPVRPVSAAAAAALRVSPNPCGSSFRLHFTLARPASVSLRLYDVAGTERARLLDAQPLAAGDHVVSWDGAAEGRPLPAGVYFCRMHGAEKPSEIRLVLLR